MPALQELIDTAIANKEAKNPLSLLPVNHVPVQEEKHRSEILKFLTKHRVAPCEKAFT